MRNSLFAKLLVMLLCLCLVLCGCAESADNDKVTVKNEQANKNEDNNPFTPPAPLTPEEKAEASLGNTLSAMFISDADFGILEDDLTNSKITIAVGDYLENVLYLNAEDFQLADELSVNIDGVSLNAAIYADEHDLALTLPGMVDGAYGVSFDTLATDLPGSAIWQLMGTDYEEVMGEVNSVLGQITDSLDTALSSTEELEDLLEDILDNVDKKTTEGTVTIDGEDVDAIIVTYALDADGIQEIVDIVIDYVEDTYMGSYADIQGMEDYEEVMTEEFDSIRSEVDAFFAEADIDAELVTNINAETGYIMTVEGEVAFAFEGEEGTLNLDIDLGKDASASDAYSMKLYATTGDATMDILGLELARAVSGSKTTYTLTCDSTDGELLTASLSYDSSNYAYAIEAEMDSETIGVNGIFKLTDDVLEFTVDSVEAAGETTEIDLVIKVEAAKASDIPDVPKYTNILQMSEDELTELLMELSTAFGA